MMGQVLTQFLANKLLPLHLRVAGLHLAIVVVQITVAALIIPKDVTNVRGYVLFAVSIVNEVVQLRIVLGIILVEATLCRFEKD